MKTNHLCGLAVLVVLGFGCVSVPPREVRTGAGAARGVVLDSSALSVDSSKFGLGAHLARGDSVHDNGEPRGSSVLEGHGEFKPHRRLGIGLRPYYAVLDGRLDSDSHFGWEIYTRWAFLETSSWRFSSFASYKYAQNKASESGEFCSFWGCTPSGETSSAKIRISEPALSLIAQKFLDEHNALALVPSAYFTFLSSSNEVGQVRNGDYSAFRLNYAGMLYYQHFIPSEEPNAADVALSVGGGASSVTGFGAAADETRINPLVQVGIQLGISKPKPKEKVKE